MFQRKASRYSKLLVRLLRESWEETETLAVDNLSTRGRDIEDWIGLGVFGFPMVHGSFF